MSCLRFEDDMIFNDFYSPNMQVKLANFIDELNCFDCYGIMNFDKFCAW